MKALWVAFVVLMLLAGCDGFYHLVPKVGENPRLTVQGDSELYVRGHDVIVRISGGAPQSPYTKKVDAHWLSVYVDIHGRVPCEWRLATARVLSAGQCTASNRVVYSVREPLSRKVKQFDSNGIEKWPSADHQLLALDSGESSFQFFFESEGGGMKRFEFPVSLALGSVVSGSDTLLLDSLMFDAERGSRRRSH